MMHIVGPVLEKLGFTETPMHNSWPQVWWVVGGWLILFPIHAAGYHHPSSTRNTLDRVISSYAPTLKSLAISRQRQLNNCE